MKSATMSKTLSAEIIGSWSIWLIAMTVIVLGWQASPSYATEDIEVPGAALSCFFVGHCTKAGHATNCTCTGLLGAITNSLNAERSPNNIETLHCKGNIIGGLKPDHVTICHGSDSGAPPCAHTAAGLGIPETQIFLLNDVGETRQIGPIGGYPAAATQDWQEVLKPSGEVTLICQDLKPQGQKQG